MTVSTTVDGVAGAGEEEEVDSAGHAANPKQGRLDGPGDYKCAELMGYERDREAGRVEAEPGQLE